MDSGIACRGKGNGYKEPHCLYPGDIYPYTRRPLFIIIDSDNSFVFQHVPRLVRFTRIFAFTLEWNSQHRPYFRYFGQPLVILMSPQDVPTSFQDYQHHGSLFTLFLHSPLTAVCYICNVGDVPIHHWERCQGYVEKFVTEASCLFTRCRVEDVGKNRDYIGMQHEIFVFLPFCLIFPASFVFIDLYFSFHAIS